MKRQVRVGARTIDYILIQAKRRDVLLRALPEGKTRVYAPAGMRLRDVDELVRQSAGQIAEMHRLLDRKLEGQRAQPISEGSVVSVEGLPRRLRLHRSKATRGELIGDELHIWLNEPESDERVRAAIKSALSALALKRISERIRLYQPQIGADYGRVTVRDQKTRWGSCSSKRNLNFNWKLIMAPPEALDYVVIHELCHLREFNHSKRFWSLVESQMTDYADWKKWLKMHGKELGV